MAARKGKEASVTVSNINTEEDWQELLDKKVAKRLLKNRRRPHIGIAGLVEILKETVSRDPPPIVFVFIISVFLSDYRFSQAISNMFNPFPHGSKTPPKTMA